MGTGPARSVFGEIRFIEKPGVQDWGGGRHVAKRCSDPPGSLPRSQSSDTWDIVRVEGIVAPFAPRGGQYSGKIRFIEAPPGKWVQETCAGFPKQRYATGEPSKVQAL